MFKKSSKFVKLRIFSWLFPASFNDTFSWKNRDLKNNWLKPNSLNPATTVPHFGIGIDTSLCAEMGKGPVGRWGGKFGNFTMGG